ncbi:MAG TPA: hypothetical protein VNG51_25950 [Ktedonobacteraceae bacterium]|nr:hypothetical protein [Ktedonobacteraceae bacterium]
MSSATLRSKLIMGGMIAFLMLAGLASSFIVLHGQRALAAGTGGFNHHPNVLISDQFNDRIFVLNTNRQIEFQYGMTNVVGNGPNQLNAPYSAVVIGDYTGVTPPPEHF